MADLIDRQAAVNAIRLYECDDYRINMGLIIAMNLIEKVPSAHPDVHGRNVGEWDMFDLITSTYYGKGMYFKQDNGTVYSRYSCEYMSMDGAIREFLALMEKEM